jgi:hypothetical protein
MNQDYGPSAGFIRHMLFYRIMCGDALSMKRPAVVPFPFCCSYIAKKGMRYYNRRQSYRPELYLSQRFICRNQDSKKVLSASEPRVIHARGKA